MSRRRDNRGLRRTVKPAATLLETIVADVIATRNMPTKDWWAQNSNGPLVSMAIPAGQGREYRVTQAGVDAAHEITRQSWEGREDFRQTIERKTFDRASFTAIGETIAGARARLPADEGDHRELARYYAALARDYATHLERLTQDLRSDTDRHILCQLFDLDQGVGGFSIGPVAFLPRADWIGRFITDPAVADTVRAVDSGACSADALRDIALTEGSDQQSQLAWEVISLLRGFAWVATIRISDHEGTQAQQKASILIGLAIDALGSRFQTGDAARFVKADRAHLAGDIRFATTATGKISRGSSVHRTGLAAGPGELAAKLAAEQSFLNAAGTILGAYVAARQTGRAPHIIERWVNALHWIGEARREASDFMAAVNYGCALDGLTGGGGRIGEIKAFAEAALSPPPGTSQTGGISVGEAVERVYAEGRNTLAHGEMPGLLEDLEELRRLGDFLLIHLLDRVTMDLANVIQHSPAKLDVPSASAIRAQIARLARRP